MNVWECKLFTIKIATNNVNLNISLLTKNWYAFRYPLLIWLYFQTKWMKRYSWSMICIWKSSMRTFTFKILIKIKCNLMSFLGLNHCHRFSKSPFPQKRCNLRKFKKALKFQTISLECDQNSYKFQFKRHK